MKELLLNKYSVAIGGGLAAIAALAAVAQKTPAGKAIGNAVYSAAFGIIIGSVVFAIRDSKKTTNA